MSQTLSRQAIVIHSPHSGRAAQLAETLDHLRDTGVKVVDVVSIADLDDLPPQGARWIEEGIDIAIAAGGDGLVGGVVMHIAKSGLPLGILPLGTANDIARSLAIPQDLRHAATVIAQGHMREVDIGTAQPAEQTPLSKQEASSEQASTVPQMQGFFAHALTVGINVQFAHLATNVATRQHYGRMTYPFAALEVLRNHTPLDVELQFEGLALAPGIHLHASQAVASFREQSPSLSCHALQATVINAPIFGGQWQLRIPGASLTDGLLDVVVIEEVEVGSLSTTFARLFSHQEHSPMAPSEWHMHYPHLHPAELTGIPGVHHVRTHSVCIRTHSDPQDVTLDGEVRGQTPISVQMAAKRLRVIVP